MDLDPALVELVRKTAKHMGADPSLIIAVMQAEGGPDALVRAVKCSTDAAGLQEAIEITCRSANRAQGDYIRARAREAFVDFWGERWAPRHVANDPHDLNAYWPVNVKTLWTA